jgi:hypothetical protein
MGQDYAIFVPAKDVAKTLKVIKQNKFTEAYYAYKAINFDTHSLKSTQQKLSDAPEEIQNENENISAILEKIGQDLFVLSSVESMYLDIFQVLKNSN